MGGTNERENGAPAFWSIICTEKRFLQVTLEGEYLQLLDTCFGITVQSAVFFFFSHTQPVGKTMKKKTHGNSHQAFSENGNSAGGMNTTIILCGNDPLNGGDKSTTVFKRKTEATLIFEPVPSVFFFSTQLL